MKIATAVDAIPSGVAIIAVQTADVTLHCAYVATNAPTSDKTPVVMRGYLFASCYGMKFDFKNCTTVMTSVPPIKPLSMMVLTNEIVVSNSDIFVFPF